MPFDSEEFSIDDALASSQDVYEVQFPDWGVRTQPAAQASVNPNFQFPPPGIAAIPTSLAALAIGPRSTVDRAWVSWDRQKLVAAIPGTQEVNPIVKESRLRRVSVEHPITYACASKRGILPSTLVSPPVANLFQNNSPTHAMDTGLLYVFPKDSQPPYVNSQDIADASAVMVDPDRTTILPAHFIDQAGVTWPFSPNTNANAVLITPYLELVLYFRSPLISPPTSRAPYHLDTAAQVTVLNTLEPVAFIPIYGRKHVGLTLLNRNLHTTDYRIGFLRITREEAINSTPFEGAGGTALAVAAGHTADFKFDNPCADYLTIFASTTAASFISIQLAAYD